MTYDNPHANHLIHEIGAAIVQSPRIASLDWKHLVFVANVANGHSTISGFAYDGSGKSRPASPGGLQTLDRITALREAMQAEGKPAWNACLIRIDRDTGRIGVDFDYDAPSKWDINPTNVREMAEKLRPAQG